MYSQGKPYSHFSTLEKVNSRAEILQVRMEREHTDIIYLCNLWAICIFRV